MIPRDMWSEINLDQNPEGRQHLKVGQRERSLREGVGCAFSKPRRVRQTKSKSICKSTNRTLKLSTPVSPTEVLCDLNESSFLLQS